MSLDMTHVTITWDYVPDVNKIYVKVAYADGFETHRIKRIPQIDNGKVRDVEMEQIMYVYTKSLESRRLMGMQDAFYLAEVVRGF